MGRFRKSKTAQNKQKKRVISDNRTFEQLSLFSSFFGGEVSETETENYVYNFSNATTKDIQEEQEINVVQPSVFSFEDEAETIIENEQREEIENETIETEENIELVVSQEDISSNSEKIEEEKDEPKVETDLRIELDNSKLSTEQKINYNLQAVRKLKQLQREERNASYEEKQILSKYSGWGGCPAFFNETDVTYANERMELKELLTTKQYSKAKESVLTSFYTPLNVIENMYKILDRMGFEHGKIIETSMGTGNFFGMMNENMYLDSDICGIEIDEISASISKFLYEKVDVQNRGFEDNSYPDNHFDLAISNIPFGQFQLHDMQNDELNRHHWNIHNYFFGKALSKVRDGGLIAFITSLDTMDGNSDIREYINERADFLGAIRLPNNLFVQNGANTSVASDIVFLRKNENKEIQFEIFLQNDMYTEHRRMNQYFVENPQMIFGEVGERKAQFGSYELTIKPQKDIQEYFDEVIEAFPENIYEEREIENEEQDQFLHPIDIEHAEIGMNTLFVENDKLYYRGEEYYYPVKTKEEVEEGYKSYKTDKDILKAKCLIEIANVAMKVVEYQLGDYEEELYLNKRKELNELYDSFYKEYGAIHKITNLRLVEDEPCVGVLEALEDYDKDTKKAQKAPLFSGRTIEKRHEVKSVDNLQDAIRLSMDTYGALDLAYMGSLLSQNDEDVKKQLLEGNLAFEVPFEDKVVLADEYLSGDIYQKIEVARSANMEDNVKALEAVIPERLEAEDIKAQLGAPWVPIYYVKSFVEHIMDEQRWDQAQIQYNSVLGQYVLKKPETYYRSQAVEREWGVEQTEVIEFKRQPKYDGYDLLNDVLNSRIPTIRNYWEEKNAEGKEVTKSEVNVERTNRARDLAERLEAEWEDWLYSDYQRKVNVVDIYNRKFNNTRTRVYDGAFLSFPQMNKSMALEPYQKNAIARIMDTNTNTLLWQQVGAGKTFEMVASGMEMRRLGIRKKILYVVPNHLVSQWQKEFMQLYPNANLLAASKKDMSKARRKVFVNKIATGNYDAIIMPHSSFKFLSVSKEKEIEFLNVQINQINNAIDELAGPYINSTEDTIENRVIKRLERTKKSIEKDMKKLIDTPRDNNMIPFEKLGIDYMFLDEAHEFKNLYIYTAMQNVSGIQTQHSQKASDMYMKCKILQESGGGICFATGTPVTNTMAELYNMQRYLQEDELKKMDINCFDAWAKAFGKVQNSFEISVDGSGFVNRAKFCKFFNVEELMTKFRNVAEIQTAGMLRKALEESTLGRKRVVPPKHIGGKPTVIALEPSEELERYIEEIVSRTEAIHNGAVTPYEDNMLKVTSDSKKASIDMRLIDPDYGDREDGKMWTIAKKVYEVYKEYDEDRATQLIFCDSSTPHKKLGKIENTGFSNVYEDLRNKFVQLGIPRDEIAFIHDYDNEQKKLELFKKMNSGEMRILLGSTPKLGAGTNVQERLIAVHHVDVPWKSSDIEQQNGRAFRQGNMFDEIYEFRYVTKRSFDAYSWQMIETKSSYMQQLLEGTGSSRELEEDNSNSFSYAEVKAIASGNPIIKEKFEIDNEVKRLENLKKMWTRKKLKAQDDIALTPKRIEENIYTRDKLKTEIEFFEGESEKNDLTKNFTFIGANHQEYKDMKEAWEYATSLYTNQSIRDFKEVFIGTFMKADMYVVKGKKGEGYVLTIDTPKRRIEIDTCNTIGRVNFSRVKKRIDDLNYAYDRVTREIEKQKQSVEMSKQIISSGFDNENELRELKRRQKEINDILDTSNKNESAIDCDYEEQAEEEVVAGLA